MNKLQEKQLRDDVSKIIRDRDLTFCARLIREGSDKKVRQVLQEVYKILNRDSDIIGMYYMAGKKLYYGEWDTEAERTALKLVKEVGSQVLDEACEAAWNKMK